MTGLNQYQKSSVTTATPMELVLMVYDECIKSLVKAEEAFKIEGPERIEQIGNSLLHAQDTINELSISLDMEKGGEIAENLSKLYEFLVYHLSLANRKKEIKPVLEVKTIMLDLREAWQQVADQAPMLQQDEQVANRGSGRYTFSG